MKGESADKVLINLFHAATAEVSSLHLNDFQCNFLVQRAATFWGELISFELNNEVAKLFKNLHFDFFPLRISKVWRREWPPLNQKSDPHKIFPPESLDFCVSFVFLKTFFTVLNRHGVFLTNTFPFCFTSAPANDVFLCWLSLSTVNYFLKVLLASGQVVKDS